jgi:hypothetical protein
MNSPNQGVVGLLILSLYSYAQGFFRMLSNINYSNITHDIRHLFPILNLSTKCHLFLFHKTIVTRLQIINEFLKQTLDWPGVSTHEEEYSELKRLLIVSKQSGIVWAE